MGFKEKWSFLNEYQMEAVLDESPACVVNANVGSGKTTVLTAKIQYQHEEKGIPLEDMIVLTFTNKAADEIRNRLNVNQKQKVLDKGEKLTEQKKLPGFGTFHSVAMYLLKEKLPIETAGWNVDFTIMDPDEETDLALVLIAEQGLKIKYKNRLKKRLEQEYAAYLEGKETTRYKDDLFVLYPLLEAEKKRQNKMSFADLLSVSTRLLQQNRETENFCKEIKDDEKKSWKAPAWIIVDEVQDSDRQQLEFLKALKGEDTHLFAVGDPNQVIYSWRGTSDNMFFLLKHQFEAKELSLPVNYRSNASILEAANRFLQYGNQIQGSREPGQKIVVKNYYDAFQEAEYLAERIKEIHEKEKIAYNQIAVFYRLQKQAEMFAKIFERQGIPFELSARKTLKDVPVLDWFIKVLRFSVNPKDEQTGIAALLNSEYGLSYGTLDKKKLTKKKAAEIVREKKKGISPLYDKMVDFSDWIVENFSEDGPECGKVDTQESEKESGQKRTESIFAYFDLQKALHPSTEMYEENRKKVIAFLKIICGYCGKEMQRKEMLEFLNSSALYGMKMDAEEQETTSEEKTGKTDAVRLMTLHASKGLEFDTVFLTGVNQGLIPLNCKSYEQEEEERRLFFVGITRAKNHLELSWYTNPGEPGVAGIPSRYLKMIPEHLLAREDQEGKQEQEKENWRNLQEMRRKVRQEMQKKEAFSQFEEEEKKEILTGKEAADRNAESASVKTEEQDMAEETQEESTEKKICHARHPKYGTGILIGEDELTVEVEFEGYGKKKFLKAFGEVEVLD